MSRIEQPPERSAAYALSLISPFLTQDGKILSPDDVEVRPVM